MRVRKKEAQNTEKKGRILMGKIKSFEKENKIKELGDKIYRFVGYYEKNESENLELAALADTLFSIKEIFKNYDRRFEELEKNLKKVKTKLGIYTNKGIKRIKVGGTDPD